jgi:phage-related protein
MAQLTGVSDDVIQHSENVMLTFSNLGKNIFPQAETAALNMSTMLGTDLQGSVIQVGKALNDPIKGIASLSREGVSFSAVEKTNIATMMQHNNIAGAQAVIMSELNKQFGGAAVSAGTTFGGAMARLNVITDQAKEKLGLALLPILGKILTAIMPLVTQFGANLPGAMATLTDFISKNVSPVIDKLSSLMQGNLIPVLVSLGKFIITNVIPTLVEMATWFQGHIVPILLVLFNVIKTDVMPALAQVWASISANLIPAIQNLWNKLSPILVPALQLVGAVLKNVVGPALAIVIGIIGKLIDFISLVIGKIGDFIGMLGNLKNIAGNVLGGVGNALHNAHIPGFAVGGVMQHAGLAMVGERGPEVVALPAGARVFPTGTGPKSGNTWNITMHGTNMTVQDVQRELWRQAVLHG